MATGNWTSGAAPPSRKSEQLKARRNAETAEIAKLRREGADTTERQQQMRAIGERIAVLDAEQKAAEESFREMLAGIPNLPHESVPVGSSEADNVEVRRVGEPRAVRFRAKSPLGSGTGAGHSRFGARGEGHRRAVRRVLGTGRETGAGADQLHARRPHARAWLHRSAAAVHGEFGEPVRHGPVAQIRAGSVQAARTRITG